MTRLLILLLTLALTGCASEVYRSYVGMDVRDLMLEKGPPDHSFDLEDGRRAFQWIKAFAHTTPTFSTPNAFDRRFPPGPFWFPDTQTSVSECIYTFIAERDEARDTWILVEFREPGLGC